MLIVFFFMLDEGCSIAANIWLSKWSDDVQSFNITSQRNTYLGVYAGFGVVEGKLDIFNSVYYRLFVGQIIQGFAICFSAHLKL